MPGSVCWLIGSANLKGAPLVILYLCYCTSVFSVPEPDRWPLLQNNCSSHPALTLFYFLFFAADTGLYNGKTDQMKSRRALNL